MSTRDTPKATKVIVPSESAPRMVRPREAMSTRDETEDQRAPMSDEQIDKLFGAGTAAKVREATNPQADQQHSTDLFSHSSHPKMITNTLKCLVQEGMISPFDAEHVQYELKRLHLGEAFKVHDFGFVLRTKTGWELRRFKRQPEDSTELITYHKDARAFVA